jgi:dephospho-CoA kinase
LGHSDVWGPASEKLMIVGLTGGIASGKTEVTRELLRLGACVIDADEVARQVILPGRTAYDQLVRNFGESILDDSRHIDRSALADIVFANEEKRQLVNGITHPAIFNEIAHRISDYAEKLEPGDVPAVIVDAALIVDIGASGVFDSLLVVTADEETRVHRLTSQRGMSESDSRNRIASQVQDSERLRNADFVIDNNGTLDELRRSVGDIWAQIEQKARLLYA